MGKNMIYVIGATGKLGQVLVSSLSRDHQLIMSTRTKKNSEVYVNLDTGVENLSQNVVDGDIVLFLAGLSDPGECVERYAELPRLVNNTVNLINKISDSAKVYFFSSDVASQICCTTDSSINDHVPNAYAWSKSQIEQRLKHNNNITILRLSNVICLTDSILDEIHSCVVKKGVFKIFHPYYRNITHVDDLLDCIRFLIESNDFDNKRFVYISGPETISRVVLYGALCDSIGVKYVVENRTYENTIVQQRDSALPKLKELPLDWLLRNIKNEKDC